MNRSGPLQRLDHLQVMVVAALSGLGLMTLYSAGGSAFHRQLFFLGLGVAAYAAAAALDYRCLRAAAPWLYGACLLLLLAVAVNGHSRLGAQRWLAVAGTPVEPSEVAKLLLVVVLAARAARAPRIGPRALAELCGIALPPLLLVLAEPDLGTAIVLAALLLGVLFLGGASRLSLAALAAGTVAIVPLVPHLLRGYQRRRLEIFLDPGRDPLGAGYNLLQARIAVGSGGWFGQGWMHGMNGRLGYVPERTTDFAFAIYAEQFGLAGGLLLLLLFAILIGRLARSAALAPDRFGALLCAGVAVVVATQVAQNVGMNIGLTPIAGIPLPLVSSGGSALVAGMAGLGLVQSVQLRRLAVLHNRSPAPGRPLLRGPGTVHLPL